MVFSRDALASGPGNAGMLTELRLFTQKEREESKKAALFKAGMIREGPRGRIPPMGGEYWGEEPKFFS